MRQHRLRWLAWSLVAVGIVLRAGHLLANRSLWLDEAMLGLNILDRGFAGLMQPLDMAQNAPLGYLWAVKVSTVLFGEGEIALRLPTFLAGIGTLVLLVPLARRLLRPEGIPVAVGLAACSAPLVYFAAEVKPYAVDVFVTTGLLLLGAVGLGFRRAGTEEGKAHDPGPPAADAAGIPRARDPGAPPVEEPGRDWWFLFLAAGILAQLFSYAAVFVLAALGTVLGVHVLVRRDRQALGRLGGTVGVWLVVFVTLYLRFYDDAAADAHDRGFWSSGFVPWGDGAAGVWSWFLSREYLLLDVVGSSLIPPALLLLLALAGIVAFVRSGGASAAALLLAPVLFALIAAGAGEYPFAGRLVLFAAVPAVLLIAHGLTGFRRIASVGLVAGVILILLFARRTVHELPFSRSSIGPLLEHVEAGREPGTPIHLQSLAVPPGTYYARRMGLDEVVVSLHQVPQFRVPEGREETLEELARRDSAWVAFSYSAVRDERSRVLRHLREHGTLADSVTLPGSAAYLYVRDWRP